MEKGMTLLEVILALFIFLLLLTGAIGFFQLTFNLQADINGNCDVQQNCRFILEQMSRDLQRAEGLVQIMDGGKRLNLEFKDQYTKHQISYYYQAVNKEVIRDDNGSSSPITDGTIIIPAFEKRNSKLIKIKLTVYPLQPSSINLSSLVVEGKVCLRNGWL